MTNENTLHTALAKAQSEFPAVRKDAKNPFFKSNYASLANILEVVLPILQKNNLYIVQSPISEGDRIGVKTRICYIDGECIEDGFTMQLAKNDPQGAGSAITYARRYALVSMLGLNVDDDDDGNSASGKKTTTNEEDVEIVPEVFPGTNEALDSIKIRR